MTLFNFSMDFVYIRLNVCRAGKKQPYTADTGLARVDDVTTLFYHLEKTDTLIMVKVPSFLLNNV